ncbi:MAG: carbohydrate ABC transporter permease, partial [Clostridia bacterium]|nr:carbohydrate ABC transporter permease [Clostridia bacterium]
MTKKRNNIILFCFLVLLAALFLFPIFIVVINSFKTKFSIMGSPFTLPNSETFAGLDNYAVGIQSSGILGAFLRSLFIT